MKSTTRLEIAEWFDQGVSEGRAWMVVWWDTFDREDPDCPSYYDTEAEVREALGQASYWRRPVEEYKLDPNYKTWQIAQARCHALEMNFPAARQG